MDNEKKHIKRTTRGWIIAAVLLLILLIGGRIALKSDWLFDKVREMAVRQANEQLRGSLSIGSIRGDLLNGFQVRDVSINDTSSTEIIRIDSIEVRYGFFELLFSPHSVESIEIFDTDVMVQQQADSSWNVYQLVAPGDSTSEEAEPLYWYVENFNLNGTNIEVRSEQYLPDGFLFVDDGNASLSAGFLETGITGTLRELEFSIREGRLPESVNVYLSGDARQDRFTLDSIVINTGRSMLRGSAQYEEGGEIEQNLQFSPLSWRDLSEYAAKTPIEQNLQVALSADGTLENLRLTLDAKADGLDQFQVQATAGLREPLSLKQFRISAEGLNAPLLTGLERAPVIRSLNIEGEGAILFGSPGKSNWQGTIEIADAAFQPYELDRLITSYSFENERLEIDGNLAYQNEEIRLTANADSLFGDQPGWNLHAETSRLNPANWLNEETWAGSLNIQVDAYGTGFDPDDFSSTADLLMTDSQIYGQAFSRLAFSGTINQNRVNGQLSGQLQESNANMEFELFEWQSEPEYEFNLEMSRLNLAELNGLEEFPTFLNGTVEGEGNSFNPEQLTMMATANFDSSIVNGEQIRELNADFRINNEFLIVDEGLLRSPIADATFSLNHHLYELTNHSNRLNFEASLKDMEPLAPLFGAENLQSEGSVSGNLGRNNEGTLEFNGDLDLENVAVDTLFSAEEITGRLMSYITEEPTFDLNAELSEPSVYQKGVQDMELYLYAKKGETETTGNMNVLLRNGNNSSLRHSGEFTVDSTTTTLLTQSLDFETDLRELTLERPFTLTYSNGRVQVDTFTISTDQGEAYLSLWAPRIDSLVQHGGLNAQNLNIGVLQETLIKESYFDGYLNGSIDIYKTPDSLKASAVGTVTELQLSEGEMDSLKVHMDIEDEWLTAELESWYKSTKLAEGSFRVPFLPGDPLTFDEQFFEREVNGQFRVEESRLDYWLSFLPGGAPETTNGTVVLESELGGIAGNPDLEGNMTVSNGLFSGINVDTVGVDIAYSHEEERLDFNGSVVRDQRQILDFEGDLPFLVDLKRADIHLPSTQDEVFADIRSNNFDLALLNSYVNREMVRGISGTLEGSVTLSGVMEELQAEGRMQLSKGSLRIVPAGIRLSEISSTVQFRQETVQLQQFSARSGPGRFRANGSVNMQGLDPGQMNINLTANRFQLFNTSDYNAIINLDARMNGTVSKPLLRGSLTFLNGFYFLQDFGDRSVETVELEGENSEESSFDFYESLDMELTIGFDRQFFVRNRQYLDMEVQIDGEVDLVKDPNRDLQMFGSIEGTDGYARPLGKEFQLEEALASFSGPVDNPEIQLRSSYTPPQSAGVTIYYIIEGTLQEPEFRFESQPQMELQDIISYTLFGRPFYELESWEQVVAGSSNSPSAADYALEVLLDRVEMLASRRLGIDVVQIDNSRSGSNNTVIKTGWYLNQKTFFAILSEIDGTSPKTLFMLEILLKENLDLVITQGDDTRQGIDLQWKRDY